MVAAADFDESFTEASSLTSELEADFCAYFATSLLLAYVWIKDASFCICMAWWSEQES